MTVDTSRARQTSSDQSHDDDPDEDDDDAPAGNGSGTGTSHEDSHEQDDDGVDYRQRYLRERRERRRLVRRLSEQRGNAQQGDDLENRAAAAERERDEIRNELRRERALSRITAEATRQGAVDPEAVATMLLAADEVEFDDQGRPVDVADAVKDLLNRKKYLAGATKRAAVSGDAGRGRGSDSEAKTDFNTTFRRLASRQ